MAVRLRRVRFRLGPVSPAAIAALAWITHAPRSKESVGEVLVAHLPVVFGLLCNPDEERHVLLMLVRR